MITDLQDRIFNVKDNSSFQSLALDVFGYQFKQNPVYHNFITNLGIKGNPGSSVYSIPFLPVEVFRKNKVVTGDYPVQITFESSGTTGEVPSKHYVSDIKLYEKSFLSAFSLFYGNPDKYIIAALLPSYNERENSSLVYMAGKLIENSLHQRSGFYKSNIEELLRTIDYAKQENKNVLLLGVSFALLDLAEKYSPDLSEVIVMETGGMKGRRKEIPRSELHSILKQKCNLEAVHSEYGMTELMSQAYSKRGGKFYCPPWMKVIIRDPLDPLTIFTETGKTGGINIIDLANVNSCAFISTGDLGKLSEDGGFEVLGRFDNSDIRGCNMMADL